MFAHRSGLPTNTRQLGPWGEKQAKRYLEKQGFKCLDTNYRCKSSELDLIMVDPEGVITFVEVKTRADEDFQAVETAVTYAKKRRMIRAARFFIATHQLEDRAFRFDVITISGQGKQDIRYYPNAFVP